LREYLSAVKAMGHLKVVEGADRELEIGALTGMIGERKNCPVLLFDAIKGYARGMRLMTNTLNNAERQKLIHGCPPELTETEAMRWWNAQVKNFQPLPPVFVNEAPVKENVKQAKDVNLKVFPGALAREGRRPLHVRHFDGDARFGKRLRQCRLLSIQADRREYLCWSPRFGTSR
jgi:4-hydroxy-3-polyprenylbenzoate decarboxylase